MNNPSTVITITTGTILRTVLVVVACALVYYLRDLLLVIVTAIVLASSLEPAVRWFAKRKVARLPAVIIIYLLLAICLVGLVFFFVPPLFEETVGFLNRLPESLRHLNINQIIENYPVFSNSVPQLDNNVLTNAAQGFADFAAGFSGDFFKTTGIIFGGILSFILIVVLSFYFAVIETGVDDFLHLVTPVRKQGYVLGLWKRAQEKIGLWMQGQILLGVIVGVLVYLGLIITYKIMGHDAQYAFLLAILAAILELIPVFGPVISMVPAVLLGFVDGGTGLGIAVLLLYILIQQFENHLIYPLVVRKVVGIPPIVVIIALIVGAKLAGFLGVLLSVPVASALKEYIDDVNKRKEAERKKIESAA